MNEDYAMEAANSALVDLEANKDAENPFRVKAKEAIARGDTVCHDVARGEGQIFDNVKHMSWFVDLVAVHLEDYPIEVDATKALNGAFAYANGEEEAEGEGEEVDDAAAHDGYHQCLDCNGEFADEDCHAIDKGFVCEGCYRKRGVADDSVDMDPVLMEAFNNVSAALDANQTPVENNSIEVTQARFESLMSLCDDTAKMSLQLQDKYVAEQAQGRKKAKRIKELETILRAAATFIAKHRPRQPAAKAKNFDALAAQLLAAANKGKKAIVKKVPAKKRR